jgi:hypothetical protein
VQVGEHNVQFVGPNYMYGPRIWADHGGQPADDAGYAGGSPYRGLRAFEVADAPFFFGRDHAVDELAGSIEQRVRDTGIVVLAGVSGAGKSSLLRAGLLPRIRRDGLAAAPGSADWPCLLRHRPAARRGRLFRERPVPGRQPGRRDRGRGLAAGRLPARGRLADAAQAPAARDRWRQRDGVQPGRHRAGGGTQAGTQLFTVGPPPGLTGR